MAANACALGLAAVANPSHIPAITLSPGSLLVQYSKEQYLAAVTAFLPQIA